MKSILHIRPYHAWNDCITFCKYCISTINHNCLYLSEHSRSRCWKYNLLIWPSYTYNKPITRCEWFSFLIILLEAIWFLFLMLLCDTHIRFYFFLKKERKKTQQWLKSFRLLIKSIILHKYSKQMMQIMNLFNCVTMIAILVNILYQMHQYLNLVKLKYEQRSNNKKCKKTKSHDIHVIIRFDLSLFRSLCLVFFSFHVLTLYSFPLSFIVKL